jgi:hypothetical protein
MADMNIEHVTKPLPELAYLRDLIERGQGVNRPLALDMMDAIEAYRAIVERVAHADNSDHGVCYQLCDVRFPVWFQDNGLDAECEMTHTKPCFVDKARALLGEE